MSISIEYAAIAKCTPEHVWQVFENIELWSRWDPEAIREVRWVSGEPWTKGAKFSIEMLKPMSFKLTPEVLDATPPFYVHFRGQGSGVTGEQHYIFRWMPEQQSTELRTLQEFSGAPIMFFGDRIKSSLEKGIAHLFARVIEEAENLARSEAPAPAAGSEAIPAHAPAAGSEAIPARAPAAPASAAGSEALPDLAPSIPDIGSGITNSSMVIPGLHACLHESLGIVFDHLATVPPELWTKELDGFGKPTVRHQIAHILAAEAWWVRRLQLLPFEKPDVAFLTSVEAVRNFQRDVKAATITYLDSLPESKLYSPLERYPESWVGPPRSPAYILLHIITHGFHHKGQLVAMLRLLGHPAPDTDIQRT
jgi:uncharacterized damage-inducible protein DinB